MTVVGDALLDVLASPSEPMRLGADVPAAVRIAPGGQGANLAVRLARRGVAVELVCAIAEDAAGRLLRDALAADGVRVRPLRTDASGAVIVLVDANGGRTMLSQRVPLAGRVADASSVAADWLVVSGYLLLEPDAATAATTLRGWAPRRMLVGCAVPDASLEAWQRAARALEPDVVILNRDEADRVPSLARERRVVTDPGGATAVIGDARATVATPPGGPAIDTTGAGDAFAAAFLAELDAAWPPDASALRRALEAGVRSGAAATRVAGAQGRIPGERSGMVDP
ncbi:MAG TPA: carbohydrate kinase family protein [Patescibacteria group bacterium]|nr:carbohydrate kinase family protein [Patescibacteria group bacterium]